MMQQKRLVVGIAILTTGMFAVTLVMSLTLQSAAATDKPICSPKSGACADNSNGVSFAHTNKPLDAVSSATGTGGATPKVGAASSNSGCGGDPGVFKNGNLLCAG
jgi:hypothetical protein